MTARRREDFELVSESNRAATPEGSGIAHRAKGGTVRRMRAGPYACWCARAGHRGAIPLLEGGAVTRYITAHFFLAGAAFFALDAFLAGAAFFAIAER